MVLDEEGTSGRHVPRREREATTAMPRIRQVHEVTPKNDEPVQAEIDGVQVRWIGLGIDDELAKIVEKETMLRERLNDATRAGQAGEHVHGSA